MDGMVVLSVLRWLLLMAGEGVKSGESGPKRRKQHRILRRRLLLLLLLMMMMRHRT